MANADSTARPADSGIADLIQKASDYCYGMTAFFDLAEREIKEHNNTDFDQMEFILKSAKDDMHRFSSFVCSAERDAGANMEDFTPPENGAPAPIRRTKQCPFFSCNVDQDPLFAVREGITLDDALAQASCFIGAARDSMYALAMDLNDSRVYAAAYLVDMSKAIIDAADTSKLVEDLPHG